jgi:hypothetical protein
MPKKSDTNVQVVEVVDEKGFKRKPLRGAYTGTIAKGAKIDLTREQIQQIGEIVLRQIREEIATDTKKASAFRAPGDPVPLPRTARFAESFQYQILGNRTLQFTSDWPTAVVHTLGRDRDFNLDDKNKSNSPEFQMWWLVQPKVPRARIVTSKGEVIVVTTPNPAEGDNLWVHPGFRRYSFLERGIRKGKQKALEAIMTDILAQTLSENGLFPQG